VILSKSRLNECSGFVIVRGGQTVTGQNWDTGESAAPMAILEIGRDPDGPDTARFTSALAPGFWTGISPHGLGTGSCSGPPGDAIENGDGIIGTLWRGPVFTRCRTVADIRALVQSTPLPGKGFNAIHVDASGAILWTAQGAGRFAMADPDTPYGAATGCRPGLPCPSTPKARANEHRSRRLMQLGDRAMQNEGDLVDDVKTMLSDHAVSDNHPDSAPCRHGGPDSSTQFSVITDMTSRTVHYCGRPCENEWRAIPLS